MSHSLAYARALIGSTLALRHPVRTARRSSGVSEMLASALRISAGGAWRRTSRLRGSSRSPRPPRATKMKTGPPNGAAPSRRRASGAKPASTRPRRRCRPARPDSASSAVSVRTRRQPADACSRIGLKSLKGVPGPAGRARRRGPQAVASTAKTSKGVRPHFFAALACLGRKGVRPLSHTGVIVSWSAAGGPS